MFCSRTSSPPPGQWMTVDPMPNAFVLNLGLQFKVISNGKFASPIHRVITHREEGRTTIATFLIPADDAFIQPPNKDHAGEMMLSTDVSPTKSFTLPSTRMSVILTLHLNISRTPLNNM
ncbi:UNVERIFIED_CONTAM: 2'-deoxymugineic-acid 2'-dioxygenase [Sesamum angustifolium]|uniref:2'-deoxymugineic-acid 2'-dioxygenase n=1 Tax=Sesamum angustifolium TaxID=2727405 RepID=A0AAW2IJS2_9LAMI